MLSLRKPARGVRVSLWLSMVAAAVGGVTTLASCGGDESASPTPKADGSSELDGAGSPVVDGGPDAPPVEVVLDPDELAPGEADVVTVVRTTAGRKAISPLIYGINTVTGAFHAGDADGITWVRRGGDRANAYNWETNVSNGSWGNDWANDLYLAEELTNKSEPAGVDLAIIRANRAAGRGTMVPFVLNDWVAGPVGAVPYDNPGGFDRNTYFERAKLVKPSAFATTPNLGDGQVFTDEHFAFLRTKLQEDIYAPGPTQVMVGIDNEPDLYAFNYPMLQEGTGDALYTESGVQVGQRVTGNEFTARYLQLTKRIKALAPQAHVVGPSHYHFDGWVSWHDSMPEYSSAGNGKWYMDDFLAKVKQESEAAGVRLIDTWDFHWYPQTLKRNVFVWDLDDSVRPLTGDEIEAIVQGPRSYWDHEYDEDSWITRDHLEGPAWMLERLQTRVTAAYPGTHIGVSEYFPGGCAHVSSAVAVADTLGIFARMGVHLAAMWPTCDRLEFALGAVKLLRNADGNGQRFADTVVSVEHPEKVETSVYAGSDDSKRVTVLVVNKTTAERKVGVRMFHTAKLAKVNVFRVDAAHASPHLAAEATLAKQNAFPYAAPPMSASLLVFTAP